MGIQVVAPSGTMRRQYPNWRSPFESVSTIVYGSAAVCRGGGQCTESGKQKCSTPDGTTACKIQSQVFNL